MIKEIYDSEFEPHVSSGKFSISGIGGCRRKKYLELKGLFKEKFTAKMIRTFDIGDMFHRQAVKELMEKAESRGLHVTAAEVPIPEQKYISGRSDIIIADEKGELHVVDIKSCSDWTLNKAREGDVPQNYIDQVNLYLHFFKLKTGYLLFYGKHKGEIHEVEVKYDETRAKQLISEVETFMKENVEKGIEPQPCNKDISPFGCPVCGGK